MSTLNSSANSTAQAGDRPRTSPVLVSFSGIDGAGKSTQIEALARHLRQSGAQVLQLSYWDDAAVLKRFRENTMIRLFKGEKGIGSPDKPVRRNDKNVRRWYLTPGRCALFLMDAIHLRLLVHRASALRPDVIIFDRYCYDPLAAMPLDSRWVRQFARILLRVVPKPDLACVLDAWPEAAHRRKPEYPVDFLHRYRNAYLLLADIAGMKVVPPGTPEEVERHVWKQLQASVARQLGSTQFSTSTSSET